MLNVRVHPEQDAGEAQAAVIEHLRAQRPFGIDLDVQPGPTGNGFAAATDGPAYVAARAAWAQAWGADVLLAGSGGSIPIVSALAGALPDAEALLVGTTDGYANIHGPDERVLLSEFEHAVVAEADFLGRYAEAFTAAAGGGRMSAEAAAFSHEAPKGGGFTERLLAGVEKAGNRVPNPAILFLGLILFVIVLSQVLDWANVGVTHQIADHAAGTPYVSCPTTPPTTRAYALQDRARRGQGPADRRRHRLHLHDVRLQLPRVRRRRGDPRRDDRRRRGRVLGAHRRADPQVGGDLVARLVDLHHRLRRHRLERRLRRRLLGVDTAGGSGVHQRGTTSARRASPRASARSARRSRSTSC